MLIQLHRVLGHLIIAPLREIVLANSVRQHQSDAVSRNVYVAIIGGIGVKA